MTINSSLSREQFIAFRDAFRALANSRQLTATDELVYNLIRGLPADRGFSPVTNPTKLANGARADFGFYWTSYYLKSMLRYSAPKMMERYKLTADQITALSKEL